MNIEVVLLPVVPYELDPLDFNGPFRLTVKVSRRTEDDVTPGASEIGIRDFTKTLARRVEILGVCGPPP